MKMKSDKVTDDSLTVCIREHRFLSVEIQIAAEHQIQQQR